MAVGEWKPNHKLLKYFATIQPRQEVLDRIREVNPYAERFIEAEAVNPYVYCMAPQLEQIHKNGDPVCRGSFPAGLLWEAPVLKKRSGRIQPPGKAWKEPR